MNIMVANNTEEKNTSKYDGWLSFLVIMGLLLLASADPLQLILGPGVWFEDSPKFPILSGLGWLFIIAALLLMVARYYS